MINFLEKFFFKRFIKKLVPVGQKYWEKHKDELVQKAEKAIKEVVKKVVAGD